MKCTLLRTDRRCTFRFATNKLVRTALMDHSLAQSCDMRILYITRPVFSIDIDKLDIPFLLSSGLVVKS